MLKPKMFWLVNFFYFSLAHFSDPFVFKTINDDDIADAEKLIQTKTLQMLENSLNESVLGEHAERDTDVLVDEDTLREYFGDVYYNDTHNFEFLPGDKKLIKLLVEHVQNVDSKGDNKGLRIYKPKPTKKQNKNVQLHKENVNPTENDGYESDIDSERLAQVKSTLFKKVMEYMHFYNVNEIVDLENVPETIVSVSSQNKKIIGHIYCVICQNNSEKKNVKPKRVSYSNGCWVPSNFATHLNTVHKLKPTRNIKASSKIQKHNIRVNKINPSQNTKPEIKIEREDPVLSNEYPKIEFGNDARLQIWYNQISDQITAMTRVVHENAEHQSQVEFFLDENDPNSKCSLKAVDASPDGNCMLSSSTHQLVHSKMNSNEMKKTYKKMRADVVEFMRQNYDSFKNEIKGHVYDLREQQKQSGADLDEEKFDIEKECLFFLNNVLPKNRCWTGSETLKALSIIYKVNIINIYEERPVHVPINNPNAYKKTIILAYRIDPAAQQLTRNHYSSVTDIAPDVIYSIAKQISKKK